jgi:hypothetical protein
MKHRLENLLFDLEQMKVSTGGTLNNLKGGLFLGQVDSNIW